MSLAETQQLWIAIPAAVLAVAALVGGLWRVTRSPRYRAKDSVHRFRHAIGVLIGWPEERDPSNQKILRPAIPGIGQRMDKIEQGFSALNVHLVDEARGHAEKAAAAANYARVDATAAAGLAAEAHRAAAEARNTARILEEQVKVLWKHNALPPYVRSVDLDDDGNPTS